MKYRLKDRELQEKLDALSEVNRFSDCLQKVCEGQYSANRNYVLVKFGEVVVTGAVVVYAHTSYVLKSGIVEIQEYNPKRWNNYPEVEPPEGVLMRVERLHGCKTCALFHRFSDGASWCHLDGSCWPQASSDSVMRFRPWDDDEHDAKQKPEPAKDMHPDAVAARRYMGEEDEE